MPSPDNFELGQQLGEIQGTLKSMGESQTEGFGRVEKKLEKYEEKLDEHDGRIDENEKGICGIKKEEKGVSKTIERIFKVVAIIGGLMGAAAYLLSPK